MKKNCEEPKVKISLFLGRHEVDFIDGLGKDAMFSTGKKLNHSEIVSAIVDAAENLNLDAKDIHSKAELVRRIIEKIMKENLLSISLKLKHSKEANKKEGE